MKISTKGRYALRLMLDLATYNIGIPVSIKDIAKRQNISDKYLEQIVSVLNKAGFVRSVRGAQGGYVLTKAPAEYTVGMILRTTEGDLAPVAFLSDHADPQDAEGEEVTSRVYQAIYDAVNNVVDHITLDDLLKWQEEQMGDNYSI